MSSDEEFEMMRRALLEFALACRIERDRLAQARLENDDRRLEEDSADARVARCLADRIIEGCR
jgi:hypothetical protein